LVGLWVMENKPSVRHTGFVKFSQLPALARCIRAIAPALILREKTRHIADWINCSRSIQDLVPRSDRIFAQARHGPPAHTAIWGSIYSVLALLNLRDSNAYLLFSILIAGSFFVV